LTICFSQGSAATDLRGGGSFKSNFPRISFLNLTVEKLRNLVHFCRSYRTNNSGPLFLRHGVVHTEQYSLVLANGQCWDEESVGGLRTFALMTDVTYGQTA